MKHAKIMPPRGRTAGLWEQPSQFQIPHSVEQAFVRAMECPMCHSNLLLDQPPPKSDEKIYCPVCGWRPRTAKTAGTTVYHIAPTDVREMIQRDGIRPTQGIYRTQRAYFFQTPEQAREFYRTYHPTQRGDIWEVRMPTDVPLKVDPQSYPGMGGELMGQGPGDPEVLKWYPEHRYPNPRPLYTEAGRIPPELLKLHMPDAYVPEDFGHPTIHIWNSILPEQWEQSLAKVARQVDVEIRQEDHFYPDWEGGMSMQEMVHSMAGMGIEPQIYNAYDGDQPVGSVVFFPLEDRNLLSMIPNAPEEPVLWVEWIWVDDNYRDSNVFYELAKIVKEYATEHNLPIEAYYRNPQLQRVVERYFQRAAAMDIPPLVNPVTPGDFVPWTDQEIAAWDVIPRTEKARWKRRVRDLNQRARGYNGAAGTLTGRDAFLLMHRWQGKCAYCGGPGADSFDHAVPLNAGGQNTPDNIFPAHKLCNHELNEWDKQRQDYRDPSGPEQMSPNWLMQPAEAGITDKKLLEQAETLPPDTTEIVYQFEDGWTIREPKTFGDTHRIGELMGNCWSLNDCYRDQMGGPYDFHPNWPWVTTPEGRDFPADFLENETDYQNILENLNEPIGGTERRVLVDPQGIPRVAFFMSNKKVYEPLGRHNSEPKEEYWQRIEQWAQTEGLQIAASASVEAKTAIRWPWQEQQPEVWEPSEHPGKPNWRNRKDWYQQHKQYFEDQRFLIGHDIIGPYTIETREDVGGTLGTWISGGGVWLNARHESREDANYVHEMITTLLQQGTPVQDVAQQMNLRDLRTSSVPVEATESPSNGSPSSKWGIMSMAEETGDPELDSLIDAFADEVWPEIETAADAEGKCDEISQRFVSYLSQNGIKAETTTMATEDEGSYEGSGYGDVPEHLRTWHTVVWVERPSGTFQVDFTPHQYGYQEFPFVQRYHEGEMQRQWTSAWKRIEEHPELTDLAHSYMQNKGWDYNPPRTYPDVDENRARAIADEYDKMEHKPDDPYVQSSYQALAQETLDQYQWLIDNGYTFEYEPPGGAYASPWDATADIRDNKHMYVFPTEAGFGTTEEAGADHPLLQIVPGVEWSGQPVTYNDLFRAVHDVFGHAKAGVGFRHHGEENAWRQHAAMYSDIARHALTSETRGQNSWVNFGPYGEQNQQADQANTIYAPQKAGLLPDWATWEGSHEKTGGTIPK